jgi:dTDP-4-amino-4,6-dideoxygalactose transaminase
MPRYASESASATLPHTEKLAREIMTLPISASMSLADADYVMDQLTAIIDQI